MPEERIPEAWIGSEVVAVIYAARQHVDSALFGADALGRTPRSFKVPIYAGSCK